MLAGLRVTYNKMATISPNYSEEKKIHDVEARDSGADSDNDASIRALIEAGTTQ